MQNVLRELNLHADFRPGISNEAVPTSQPQFCPQGEGTIMKRLQRLVEFLYRISPIHELVPLCCTWMKQRTNATVYLPHGFVVNTVMSYRFVRTIITVVDS